jgi:hypothetical protein
MKTLIPIKTLLLLLSIVALPVSADVGSVQSADSQRHSEQSGIIVHAWYPSFCVITPGLPPWCTLPRPYYGTFSIFTVSGRYVASATTAEDITATFTADLRPGRYVIVPDDPALVDEATIVTVRGKRFTEVMIWIGGN